MADHRHSLQEILSYRDSLKKTIEKDGESTATQQSLSDIVTILRDYKMTYELVLESKIGAVLGEISKKYEEAEVGQAAKKLLKAWKKELKPSTSEVPANSSIGGTTTASAASSFVKKVTSGSDRVSVSTPSSLSRSVTADTDATWGDEDYSSLTPLRRSMLEAIANGVKLSIAEAVAKFIAFNVEMALNNRFPEYSDSKSYTAKARALAYNLKNNEKLRERVISGELAPEQLVQLSPRELADESVKKERDAAVNEILQSRDTNAVQNTRERIQQNIGVDTSGGEFVCGRCKGTKTSHYSMQTRSSDEPMTVFVCCLTCGKRWRE